MAVMPALPGPGSERIAEPLWPVALCVGHRAVPVERRLKPGRFKALPECLKEGVPATLLRHVDDPIRAPWPDPVGDIVVTGRFDPVTVIRPFDVPAGDDPA